MEATGGVRVLVSRLVLLAAFAVALTACGEPTSAPEGEEPQAPTEAIDAADDEEPVELGAGLTVLATVYPLGSMAEDIAPAADVRLLTASGQDPHDLELTPADRQLVETADVVLYMGDLDFQPQVEAAVADARGAVVAVAAVAGEGRLRALAGHEHDDDDGHGHEDDDDNGDVDPHVWFDAEVMAEVALALGDALADTDSGNAEAYRAAASALHDELLALKTEIDALVSSCVHDTAIVSHEAYAYLLAPRGLAQEGISGAGGHGEASPQRLADLTARIRAENISAVLAEPVEGRADAETLANEAQVDLLEIDPLEIGHAGLAGLRYPEALLAQAQAFAVALECS